MGPAPTCLFVSAIIGAPYLRGGFFSFPSPVPSQPLPLGKENAAQIVLLFSPFSPVWVARKGQEKRAGGPQRLGHDKSAQVDLRLQSKANEIDLKRTQWRDRNAWRQIGEGKIRPYFHQGPDVPVKHVSRASTKSSKSFDDDFPW